MTTSSCQRCTTLERRLQREKDKVHVLERLIEERSATLYEAKQHSEELAHSVESLLRSLPEAMLVIEDDLIIDCNQRAEELLQQTRETMQGKPFTEFVSLAQIDKLPCEVECNWLAGNQPIPTLSSAAEVIGSTNKWMLVGRDMRERQQMEARLLQAQKLESIGQLAAGVAHEINTPIQFVSDSMHFLKESYEDVKPLINAYEEHRQLWPEDIRHHIEELEEDADMEFLREEVPAALDRSISGLERVASIVKALKGFSHPDRDEQSLVDINEALSNTVTVTRNEYKYHAELSLVLGELPSLTCHLGEINQVFLNLIVNAAHAIADNHTDGTLGRIEITTIAIDGAIRITVEDDGGGVPDHIKERIFDPFFTTKAVGRGTGQGLAISHDIIVNRHNGSLDIEDGPAGARFIITIPIEQEGAQ